ncbi:MAG: type VI secretion system accessory protein TagJ [Solimonas sp.]
MPVTTFEDRIRQGDLAAALAELQAAVRARPSEAKLRVALFQLLSVLGQWDRALNQLRVAGDLDASTLLMVQTYETALRSEKLRAEVFAGRRQPLVLGEPEEWIARLLQALRLGAEGQAGAAAALRESALGDAPARAGQLDGTAFDWIADADERMGPCLELIVNGGYWWVPFERIAELKAEAPSDLRDLVWMPVQLTWINGGQAVGLVPARYAGTEQQSDDALRLARRTEWREEAGAVYGIGQRMLATDTDVHPLLGLRAMQLAAVEA